MDIQDKICCDYRKGKLLLKADEEYVCDTKLLKEINEKALVSPFVLFDSHLYRFEILKVQKEYYLFFDFHHIIADGNSMKLFIDSLQDLYDGKDIANEKQTKTLVNELFEGVLLGLTLGMLVYIAFFELLHQIYHMKEKKLPIIGISIGVIILVISVLLER